MRYFLLTFFFILTSPLICQVNKAKISMEKDFSPYVGVKFNYIQAKYNLSFPEVSFSKNDMVLLPLLGLRWKNLRAEVDYSNSAFAEKARTANVYSYSLFIDKLALKSKTLLFNIYYDFLLDEGNQLYFYIGAGVGLSRLKATTQISSINYYDVSSQNSFTWSFYAGLNFAVDMVDLPIFMDIGYKYTKIDAFNSDKFTSNSISLGLRYML